MKVEVLLFAEAKRWVGAERMEVELKAGATVKDLIGAAGLAGLAPYASIVRYAVNEDFVPVDTGLSAGDTVAVLPPVSGG